jgi:hypothetical protein
MLSLLQNFPKPFCFDSIEALEALPENIRNNEVDMKSVDEPICGTVGCFAGLVSIVAKDIPELKELYSLDIHNFS